MVLATRPIEAAFLLLLAPVLASFLMLVQMRQKDGRDFLWSRSRCDGCGRTLAPAELVPVLSFLWLKGRCRTCGAVIPPVLFQAELGAFVAAVLAGLASGTLTGMALGAALLAMLGLLAAIDIRRFRLPDVQVGAALAAALALAATGSGQVGPAEALQGAILGVAVSAALRFVYRYRTGSEGLGLGDVKLMAVVGAAVGPLALPTVTLIAAVSGIVFAARRSWRKGRSLRARQRLPFGAFLAVSTGLVWLGMALG